MQDLPYSLAEIWLVIGAGMALTYASRLSFLAFLHPDRLPPGLRRALRFVPPAVLAALVSPELLRPDGVLQLSLTNDRLVAGLASLLVAWRVRNTWATLASGLIAYAILSNT
jgi:branched-subunit amino acid transport protein